MCVIPNEVRNLSTLLDRSFVPILGTQDDIVLIIPELFPPFRQLDGVGQVRYYYKMEVGPDERF